MPKTTMTLTAWPEGKLLCATGVAVVSVCAMSHLVPSVTIITSPPRTVMTASGRSERRTRLSTTTTSTSGTTRWAGWSPWTIRAARICTGPQTWPAWAALRTARSRSRASAGAPRA